MNGDDLTEAARESKERRQRDVASLPESVRDAAQFSGSEVMWPIAIARDAIGALAELGHIVLGLDLRRYESDGRFYEAAWSAFAPTGSADISAGRDDALAALRRPNIEDMDGYDWVLITWH